MYPKLLPSKRKGKEEQKRNYRASALLLVASCEEDEWQIDLPSLKPQEPPGLVLWLLPLQNPYSPILWDGPIKVDCTAKYIAEL